MKDKFDAITKIITLVFSFVAIIISIIALLVNHNSYNINREKFQIDTTESLTISVGVESFESIALRLNENDEKPSYRIKTTICFVNNSNLPIYINDEYISRSRYSNGNYGTQTLDTPIDIEELELPILIEPQETKFVGCYMRITIPEYINQYIIDKFTNTNNLDIEEIGSYLFFEKHTDLIGNEVKTFTEGGVTHFKYNPTIPFHLSFWTTRGNYFSTEFYDGMYCNINYAIEKNYKFSIESSYGEKSKKEIILDFFINNLGVVLLIMSLIIFFEFIALRRFRKNFRDQLRKEREEKESEEK